MNRAKPVKDSTKALLGSAQKVLGELLGLYIPTHIEPLIDDLALYMAHYTDQEREKAVKDLRQIHSNYFRNGQ